ncbi:radical SAM protein [Desulfogranum marinum]|uniref:radical SAM protein n=1 Tax=Desulfogranum marinum TaxID=453220 RepID=UPI0029C7E085|nr:radical SAM protein [Desulfogranum marinum]
MDYQGDIIRPPSEANSIILQVTTGCSHNHCTFCGAYREKSYGVKQWSTIQHDLEFAARWCTRQKTMFLADGDALALPHELMVQLLTSIRQMLPWVRRVASYANCHNIEGKSDLQLCRYKELGLSRIYMGLESGHDSTLRKIGKGVDGAQMVTAGRRVRAAGMFLSVTCLLGIAGIEASLDHAQATAAVLNQMEPSQIAVLTLMILDNTPLFRELQARRFQPLDQGQLFHELRMMLSAIELKRAQFQANHASNYFSLSGRLPKDKEAMLATIDSALNGTLNLKDESFRLL